MVSKQNALMPISSEQSETGCLFVRMINEISLIFYPFMRMNALKGLELEQRIM